MKSKDIAKNYFIDGHAFDLWISGSGYLYKKWMLGAIDIDDSLNIQEIVREFKEDEAIKINIAAKMAQKDQERLALDEEKSALAAANRMQAAQQTREALASMLIISGFNFDGYTITKYSGCISGDDAVQIDRGTSSIFSRATDVGSSPMASLNTIRRNAISELKEAAYALGCNAVIGVDFDYLTLDPQTATSTGGTMYLPYVFGVTANGNPVIIENNIK